MYRPALFRCDDPALLREVMEAYPFATLIAALDGVPEAAPVPVLAEEGAIVGHLARANPIWRSFGEREVLLQFHGPHAYVSPRWYGSPEVHVPTWSYVAVSAWGVPELLDAAATRALLVRMVERFDPTWRAGDSVMDKLLPGVVGFRVPLSRIEGKMKLSQNRERGDIERVRSALEAGGEEERAVARWMSKMDYK